jgi:hypothetical protein
MQCRQLVRHKVALGLPGPSFGFGAIKGAISAFTKHDHRLLHSGSSGDNFNEILKDALNLFEAGEITHLAQLHADVTPDECWGDIALGEMDRLGATFMSVPSAIKDLRGVHSCGIGDPADPWRPFRRITSREMDHLPETFSAEDFGYPGGILLHNNACWIADLRDQRFFSTDADGDLIALFDFPKRIRRDAATGKWIRQGESEDWFFSRKIHALGIPSYITRKVSLHHKGTLDFPNKGIWGRYEKGDEDTRDKWDPAGAAERDAAAALTKAS